jgi:hypothetical protein
MIHPTTNSQQGSKGDGEECLNEKRLKNKDQGYGQNKPAALRGTLT